MTDFLQELSEDIRLTEFDSFAEALLQLLEKHLDTACAGCIRSRSVLKEKAWIAFHQLRIDELPKKWSQFTPQLSPIICQHVNYELYAELLKSKLCGTFGDIACNTDVEVPELNEDEENIIRYAAGVIYPSNC